MSEERDSGPYYEIDPFKKGERTKIRLYCEGSHSPCWETIDFVRVPLQGNDLGTRPEYPEPAIF